MHIHDIIQFILDNQPFLLHIVLITDEDPPLAFARTRFARLITELRVEELRFSEAETALFMAGMVKLNLENEIITLFNIMTEGQIAGLQLTALAIFGSTPEEIISFLLEFSRRHRNIIDYLVSKVLANLSKEVCDFLLQTVILDRLCGPLCNEITGREDSRELLEFIEHGNLFLLPLDKRRQWYGYHPLFAGLLRAKLSNGEKQALQQREVDWYLANGYLKKTVTKSYIAVNYPGMESKVIAELTNVPGIPSFTGFINSLSDREMELLRLVAAGLSNEEISREMTISINTIKYHLKNIFRKLNVKNRYKAAMKARELNLA